MSTAPDFVQVARNIAATLPSFYSVLGYMFIAIALAMVFSGILDLIHAGDKKKKMMGTSHGAGAWSGIVKIFVGGLLGSFADNGVIVHMMNSVLFGNIGYELLSLDSYVPGKTGTTEEQQLIRIILVGFTQVIGMISVFKGLRSWVKAADKTGKESFWHGVMYIIFGVLCIQMIPTLALMERTLGFSFLSMVGLNL